MLSFNSFILVEQFLTEEISSNDAKGKLHELLVAKHLHKDKKLPNHYRDEKTQKSPKETHDYIVEKHLSTPDKHGKTGVEHEDYINADNRAKEAAEKIKSHLGKHFNFERLKKVAWTSNKTDHKKFTGDEDPNSDADVMLHIHKHKDEEDHPGHFVGLSLKVGSQKPNLRNPGLRQLSELTKADHSKIEELTKKHIDKLHDLGYSKHSTQETNHAKYKEDKVGKNGADRKKVSVDAENHSKEVRRGMAKHYAESVNNLPSHHVEHLMRTLIAPKNVHDHYRVHTKTHKKTGATLSHEIEDHQKEFDSKYAGHDGYEAVHSGISLHIHAKHKNEDGTYRRGKRLASITMKQSSGPAKGIAGAVKAY